MRPSSSLVMPFAAKHISHYNRWFLIAILPGSVLQAPSNLKSGLTNSKGFHRLYTATGASQKQSLDRHLQAAADGGPFQELNYWTRANDSIFCISSHAAQTTKLGGRATYIAFRLLIQIQVPIRLKINSAIAFISLALMSHPSIGIRSLLG